MNKIELLQKLIETSHDIVVMTGAGFSKASGIPDFRSTDGLYNNLENSIPPEEILSHHYFIDHPKAFYQYYFTKMLYPNALPNKGHLKLFELEQSGRLKAIITQNIDGLHQKAGCKKVLELHGSVLRNHCINCHQSYSLNDIINKQNEIPLCSKCGSIIKPDVVLYEEGLNEKVLNEALKAVVEADLLIIAGSSMVVNPAASLPYYFRGKAMVIINLDKTPLDDMATLIIKDKCEEVLASIRIK